MQESGNRQFVLKKAYEISYALFRIAARLNNFTFREYLERQALSLLDGAAMQNYPWMENAAIAIEYLIKFGADVGILHETNVEVIVMQLKALNAAIAGLDKPATASGPANLEPVVLEDIFQEPLFSHKKHFSTQKKKEAKEPMIKEAPKEVPVVEEESLQEESGNAANRQSAILERIRQSGNCRLKDIQELLPDCSERTIRYDLQSLIEQNLIERVGSGGPSVFYRIRQPG